MERAFLTFISASNEPGGHACIGVFDYGEIRGTKENGEEKSKREKGKKVILEKGNRCCCHLDFSAAGSVSLYLAGRLFCKSFLCYYIIDICSIFIFQILHL